MRVRVAYTLDIDDDVRRAINLHYGRPGLATREEVQRWYETQGTSSHDDLMSALQQQEGDDVPPP